MNSAKQHKKIQDKAQKEQMEVINKLVGIANEILEVMKSKDLKVYECDILVSLLSQRVKEGANGYVGQLKLDEVIKK